MPLNRALPTLSVESGGISMRSLLPDYDRINNSPSVDEQPDLPRKVTGDLHHGARSIERDDLGGLYSSAIKIE